MRRVFYRSIILRYIISYVAVMAVLFIGVGIYVNNSYASAIHASIVEENTNRLSALRLQHEEKLSALINIANQISLSPYITPFKLKENALKAYYLKEHLISYNADNFFDQLYVVFHEDDYLYSSSTSISMDIYTEKLMYYDGISPESLCELLRKKSDEICILPSMSVHSVLTSDTNKKMVTVIIPLRLNGRYIVGNAVFLIQDNAYQRMFTDEILQDRNMYIFSGQNVISAKRTIDIPDDVILNEVTGMEEPIIRNIALQDGTKYILFAQRGSLLDLCYVSLIPQETVQMQTARSRLTFSLFLLLLSVPCGLLTVYFANSHIRPIKEIQKSIGDVLTSEDGFSAIKKGIETLKGQNRVLNTRLNESKDACRADFVKKFVKCRFSSREQAINIASDLGMDIDRPFYCVSLMSALPAENKALELLNSLLADGSDVKGYGMEIFDYEQYLFVLFANEHEALEDWVNNAKSVLFSFDNEAVISASNIHADFSEATNAYLEASTAYDNRFVMGNEHVLWFSDVSSAAKDIEPFTENYLDGFRKALYAGDADALHDRIDELFQILKTKKFSLFAFRIIYNEIISMLLNKYLSYDEVSEHSIKYYDIFELSRCRRVSDLTEILRRLCNDILQKEEQNMPDENPVIGRVIDYIRENYTDPGLSMGTIASIHGMSAATLSLKYKEQTGMYPSEYLVLLRMEKAKELLAGTDMSIQDIGTSVGYYDASSFIRRFKQHMGITPAKYRILVKNIN